MIELYNDLVTDYGHLNYRAKKWLIKVFQGETASFGLDAIMKANVQREKRLKLKWQKRLPQ